VAGVAGLPGTATILPVLMDQGYHKGRLGLQRIAQLLCGSPASIFGLPQKGRIALGADADFALVSPDFEREVQAAELGSFSDYSLYDGWRLRGWPRRTIVRGATVMRDGEIVAPGGTGRFLRRTAERANGKGQ
jgi:dihydropyrimidinase